MMLKACFSITSLRATGALVGLLGGLFLSALHAQTPAPGSTGALPAPDEIRAIMEHVGDWQLAHPSAHPAHDWTQAAGYAGMMALGEIATTPRYLEAMYQMGEANQWELGPRLYHADDQAVSQTYLELFLRRPEPKMIAAVQTNFDEILAHPKDDELDFDQPGALDKWSWCDSLFMAPPAWTRLYYVTGKQAYLDYLVEHWWNTSAFLYDKDEHLYYRDSHGFSMREANGKKVFWSRGNGWVLAGLARVLNYLPAAHPSRARFEQQFKEMAAKILTLQQEDGLWRASLLDPQTYAMKETSGSGFYCYALAWGVNTGYLGRSEYGPAIEKAWKALTACVEPDGKLTHVQPIGWTPKTFDPEATEVYGVGAFLLAGSEVYRLAGGVVKENSTPRAHAAP